jgi:hypothetical protein
MALGGDILIKLSADVAELRSGFASAKKEVSGFASKFDEIGKHIEHVATGLFAAFSAHALFEFAKSSAEAVGDLGELSEALGITTDAFQAFQEASARGGVGAEGFEKLFLKFNKTIGSAAEGTKEAIDAFDNIGVKLLDAKGKLLPTGDVAQDVAKKILAIEDPAKRAAAAATLFGKSGPRVLAVLKDMAEGADVLAGKLAARGGIASQETIDKLDAFFDSIKSTQSVLQKQGATVFANLLPDIKPTLDAVEELGNSLVRLSGNPMFQPDAGHGFFDFVKTSIEELTGIADFVNKLPAEWDLATTQMAILWLRFSLKFETITEDARKAVAKWISDLVNGFIEGVNKIIDTINNMPEKVKQFLGLSDVPHINEFKVTIESREGEIAKIKTAIELLEAQAANSKINIATSNPQLPPPIGSDAFRPKSTGVSNPLDKGTSDKIAKMLAELVGRQKAEERALKAMEEAGNTPLRDLDRQIETQKKIDEAISKARADNPKVGGALIKQIEDQIRATENAEFRTKEYRQALGDAVETEKQFGDGSRELNDELIKLGNAYSTGKLSTEAYTAAVKEATEAAKLQSLKARGQVEGLDAVEAGFEAAAIAFAKANNSFAQGGQLFTGVVDLMSNALDELVDTGQINFGKLLLSFSSMITKMALQAAASAVFKSFFDPASSSGGGGVGLLAGLGQFLGGLFTSGGAKASGGNVRPGVTYTVGENGREQFIPAIAGQIKPIEETMGAGMRQIYQSINITTPDANSFRRSRRQIARQGRAIVEVG